MLVETSALLLVTKRSFGFVTADESKIPFLQTSSIFVAGSVVDVIAHSSLQLFRFEESMTDHGRAFFVRFQPEMLCGHVGVYEMALADVEPFERIATSAPPWPCQNVQGKVPPEPLVYRIEQALHHAQKFMELLESKLNMELFWARLESKSTIEPYSSRMRINENQEYFGMNWYRDSHLDLGVNAIVEAFIVEALHIPRASCYLANFVERERQRGTHTQRR